MFVFWPVWPRPLSVSQLPDMKTWLAAMETSTQTGSTVQEQFNLALIDVGSVSSTCEVPVWQGGGADGDTALQYFEFGLPFQTLAVSATYWSFKYHHCYVHNPDVCKKSHFLLKISKKPGLQDRRLPLMMTAISTEWVDLRTGSCVTTQVKAGTLNSICGSLSKAKALLLTLLLTRWAPKWPRHAEKASSTQTPHHYIHLNTM